MNTDTCDAQRIAEFLSDRLTPDEVSDFEQHLDHCDACCAALHEDTATKHQWQDAQTFLSTVQDIRLHPQLHIQADPDAAGAQVEFELEQLTFLAPTDDPRMLGRFAGYEVSGVIGVGGMGIVLKAYDAALNRYAAIKVLAPHFASSGAARQRFAREAQAAAAVVHENVVAIHGVDEFNGLPYLVMPYIRGESLQKRIDREGPLGLSEILRIGMQTARGLSAAHDQGLVHRDIKPANILLPDNVTRVLITDFGLARAADDASLTRSGVIAGTPQFMSPEQAQGEGVDGRSDLFSLGSLMYMLCTGHPPFRAETTFGILRRITDHAHRPIREINAEIPEWLCELIDLLLQKRPEQRPETATAVAVLMEECLAHVQQPESSAVPPALLRQGKSTSVRNGLLVGLVSIVLSLVLVTQLPDERDSAQNVSSQNVSIQSDATEGDRTGQFPAVSSDQNQVVILSDSSIDEADLAWDAPELTELENTIEALQQELPDSLPLMSSDLKDD